MRKDLCDALVARAGDPRMVFLTGDLGFMALEPLRDALGDRFINAGVAEQNMVTVAAGLAAQGLDVWAYSIAPFLYARAFEQIRNDICFHDLPVKLIGNGGGYGYGVMGPTHHAIDDYGALLTLANMGVLVPAFDQDVRHVVSLAAERRGPTYLRIGRGEPPSGWAVPEFRPWRQLTDGGGPVLVCVGPLVGTYVAALEALPVHSRPSTWVAGVLPVSTSPAPPGVLELIAAGRPVLVVEEHVRQGSFAGQLLLDLIARGCAPARVGHLFARAHVFARYGSQAFLRTTSGLDCASLLAALDSL